jgi:uncharacterized protein
MRMDEQPQPKGISKDAPKSNRPSQHSAPKAAKAAKAVDNSNAAMGNAFAAALAKMKK